MSSENRGDSCALYPFLGSSIFAPVTYPFAFINKTQGPFHFPLASSHLLPPRDPEELEHRCRRRPLRLHQLGRCINLFLTRNIAMLLRHPAALVSTPLPTIRSALGFHGSSVFISIHRCPYAFPYYLIESIQTRHLLFAAEVVALVCLATVSLRSWIDPIWTFAVCNRHFRVQKFFFY